MKLRAAYSCAFGIALIVCANVATAQIVNPSFEIPAVADYQYAPTGSGIGWTIANGGGIQHNGGAFGGVNAPDGVQTGFLQSTGYMAQSLNLSAGSYQVSFQAARRAFDSGGVQPVRVKIDGQQVGSLVSPPSTSFSTQAISFSITTTGSHELRLEGTVQDGTTTFVDAVSIVSVGGAPPSCTSAAPSAPKAYGTTGTFRVYAYGVTNTTSMQFPTWGGASQDDLYWYNGVPAGGGTWYADIDLSRHKTNAPEYGAFTTDVYMSGPNGSNVACQRTTWQRVGLATCSSAAPETATTSATWGTFKVYTYNVVDATSVKFPVWADPAQSDLIWYDAVSAGGGTWYANVDLGKHKSDNPIFGTFTAHVYAINPAGGDPTLGAAAPCAYANWSRNAGAMTCSQVLPTAATTSATSGLFEICGYGVINAARVTFPTWSNAGGQDDLVEYVGTDKGGGKYCTNVDLSRHKPNAPDYGDFTTHMIMSNPSPTSPVTCPYSANWARIQPVAGISKTSGTSVTVTLDGQHGGQVGSIVVPTLGETIVNNLDGQGLGTSGFIFTQDSVPDLWVESGCQDNGHNSDVAFSSNGTSITGTALTLTSWASGPNPGCDLPSDPARQKFKNVQISHTVSFPNPTYKAVAIQQTITNLVGIPITLATTNLGQGPNGQNQNFNWPIAPQVHFDRTRFVDIATNKGHWRNRQANGTWLTFEAAQRSSWLDATADFYPSPGHALAVYKDAALTSGVALYCPTLDSGFYALDIKPPEVPIMFIGNVLSVTRSIANNGSLSRTCLVVYGTESQISAAINAF